jgi:hypothetical protein
MRGFAWRSGVLVVCLAVTPAVGRAAWRSEGPALANISFVAVDPIQPATIYAATLAGGVWRSDDGGKSWTLPGDGMLGRNVKWIEPDPKPRDPLGGIEQPGGRASGARPIEVTGPWSGSIRLLRTGTADRFRRPPRIVYVPSTNLHYRSADGGKTWESFRVPGQDAYAFAIHPQKPNIIYAGGRGSEHNLSRSQDGGKTWRPFGQGLAKDNSIKLLRISSASSSTLYAVAGFGRVHRSTDGARPGRSWSRPSTDVVQSRSRSPRSQGPVGGDEDGRPGAQRRRYLTAERTWGYLCKGMRFIRRGRARCTRARRQRLSEHRRRQHL